MSDATPFPSPPPEPDPALTGDADLAIQLQGVTYIYPGNTTPTLDGVDWQIEAGEFVVVAGPSGGGKSTLLRSLNGLVPHFSGGRFGGQALIEGHDTRRYGPRVLSRIVGFVFQDPESQLVTTRVDDELAFGMEQLGVPPVTMRKRVEEVLDLLDIVPLRSRDVTALSGGERQRVAVAAALALQPRILVLDEPTSQLDPWAAEEVLTALARLNEDLGLTIVLAEHRLERIINHADRMRLVPGAGETPLDGPTEEVLAAMDQASLPPLAALGRALGWDPLPRSVKAGRLRVRRDRRHPLSPPPDPAPPAIPPSLRIEGVHAAYGRAPVLRDLELEARPGELIALMGRNGAGKTTVLRLVMGLHRPSRGRITVCGRNAVALHPADLARDVGYVPQHPGSLLFAETLRDELAFTLKHHGGQGSDPEAILAALGLTAYAGHNPRDLSGGERQRAALAAVLVAAPKVLLLDEPTRGMDALAKRDLGRLLCQLREEGTTILLASHDVELVATIATRVVLLGDGRVVADGGPRAVLSGSLTFSTQINKLYGDGFLTVADVLSGLEPPLVPDQPRAPGSLRSSVA
ncbi:MAG: ATP-binding cassette domain-containing protein [Chloroflexia bacterium]|nr:ATP-binding cassette domain-containing protein [Chloroflexia bacterium]